MQSTLLKNVWLYDPDPRGICDLLLCGGILAAVGCNLMPNLPNMQIIDCGGLRAVPGLIDQHVHFTGGGGERGFRSRVPELSLTDFTCNGVTTAVGVLGTDSATRSPQNLLAKTKALNEEGITAYCLTGAYDIPSPTITGSVKDDIVFLSEVIGVKLALSDHRSGHPTVTQLIQLASQVRLGALTADKAGIVHIHTGVGKAGLQPIFAALENSDLPIFHFRPTHAANALDDAIRFAQLGGRIDFTASTDVEGLAKTLLCAMETVPLGVITLSSDAGGSIPQWSADHRELIGMRVGTSSLLLPTIACLVERHGVALEQAIRLLTSNVAEGLLLPQKGHLTVGADADILILNNDYTVHTLFARGQCMIAAGEVVCKPFFQS